MRILFYQNPPLINSTLLTWTLCEELRLLGHQVDYCKPKDFYRYDWIHGAGNDAPGALSYARKVGAKCHIHLEGVAYWRIGYEDAINWGYDRNHTGTEIEMFRTQYKSWMSAAYEADSCTVAGPKQVGAIEWLFEGNKLPNCHLMHCGVDARYALSLPDYPKQNYMITVSRLEPNKKVFKIAEALAILKQSCIDIPGWMIVGYGTQEQENRLLEFCRENKISVAIKQCFGAEKWYWIKRAKLMLSGWSGIPPEEAIICKAPCLSFTNVDINSVFEDTLWYADDEEEYAKMVKWLLENMQSNLEIIYNKCEYAFLRLIDKLRPFDKELYASTQERVAKQYEQIFMEGFK